jgi:hypothetical protein
LLQVALKESAAPLTFEDPFYLPDDFYTRDLDQLTPYIDDSALYLSIMTKRPIEQCKKYVQSQLGPGGKFEIVDPEVIFLHRESPGNRVKKVTTLSKYMQVVAKQRYIMTPTFTSYLHPDKKESILAKYIKTELDNRSANKKLMFKHQNAGNKLMEGIYKNRQNRNKIKCNSMSGAQGTKSSVLVNKSAHSTLTTICRSASSNTNANVERYLTGNRHYWSVDTTINNIVNIVRRSDYNLIRLAIDFHELVYPTVDDTLFAIKRCTDLYWRDPNDWIRIVQLINNLTPIQRAAYLYTGDLYSLAKLNRDTIYALFTGLTTVAKEPIDNPSDWMKKLGEDEFAMLGIICGEYLTGFKDGLKDDAVPTSEHYPIIGATAKLIIETVQSYGLIIRAFWMTKNIPSSMALFPESIRRSVIASDTDSSIFTTQDWTKWYVGQLDFTDESFKISAATTYLCSRLTAHTLCVMSGNIGVATKHLRMLEMKNEYAFKMFSLTSMGKHYFAAMAAQEGKVLSKFKWEVKGATLKNSKAPTDIMQDSDKLIKDIGVTIMSGKKLKLLPILKDIATKEINIMQSIKSGSVEYFSRAQIKDASSYKTENSPYLQYELWDVVFGPKYGKAPPPPYGAIKVSINTDTAAKFGLWLTTLDDRELADRFRMWMELRNKNNITTLYLPVGVVQQTGIPKELIPVMNIRNMVLGIMKSYYLVLESLGYYILNDEITRLVSDDFVV